MLNATLSLTTTVQERKFYAHRIALLASSDTFKAMFDGHYREKEASQIPIPNIRFSVFERMMRCIYTGACFVSFYYSCLCFRFSCPLPPSSSVHPNFATAAARG